MSARYWIAAGAIAAAIPLNAVAQEAVTVRDTDIFAGPSSDFPSVAHLSPNVSVNVAGCLSDWSWCDVSFSSDRGWVYAADIAAVYEGRPIVIIESGPRIHLPVETFSLVTYWDQHYRSKPFYGERQQWVSRVNVEGGHGGPPPAGHERIAQRPGEVQGGASAQSSTNERIQQGQQGQAQQKSTEAESAPVETPRSRSTTGMTESRPPAQAQQQQERPSDMTRSQPPAQSLQREERPPAESSRGEMMSPPSKSESGTNAGERAPMREDRSAERASKAEPSPKAAEQPPKGRARGQENESRTRESEQQ